MSQVMNGMKNASRRPRQELRSVGGSAVEISSETVWKELNLHIGTHEQQGFAGTAYSSIS